MRFVEAVGTATGASQLDASDFWTKDQIEAAQHADNILAADHSFRRGRGGGYVRILYDPNDKTEAKKLRWNHDVASAQDTASGEYTFGNRSPFRIEQKQFNTADGWESQPLGTVWQNIREGNTKFKRFEEPQPIRVNRISGARFSGTLDIPQLIALVERLEEPKTSPITFSTVTWSPQRGIHAVGHVESDFAQAGDNQFVEGDDAKPEITIDGDDADYDGAMPADAIDPPGPIQIVS